MKFKRKKSLGPRVRIRINGYGKKKKTKKNLELN